MKAEEEADFLSNKTDNTGDRVGRTSGWRRVDKSCVMCRRDEEIESSCS